MDLGGCVSQEPRRRLWSRLPPEPTPKGHPLCEGEAGSLCLWPGPFYQLEGWDPCPL